MNKCPSSVIPLTLPNEGSCALDVVPLVDRSSPIEETIESFLGSQIPKKTTARGYRRHLLHAAGMMALERLEEAQPVHLVSYRRYLLADGRGTATHAQALIALRSFLTWGAAMRGHDIPMDQALYLLKVPKVYVITPHETLNQEEIRRVLEKAQQSGPRDHALMVVALGSGVRVAELVALDIRDIRHDGGDGTMIHVRQGKGGKDRMIPVRPEVRHSVEAYLKATGRKRGDAGPLFLSEDRAMGSRDHWRLTTRSATRIVKACAEMAGIEKRISPHALRHTFAFASYLYCKNLMAVSKLLGHATITTTQRYLQHLDQLDLRKAIPAFLAGGRGPKVQPETKKTA